MQSRLSVTDLHEWQQFFREEPFGYLRVEQLLAVLIQTVINMVSSNPISFQYVLDNLIPKYVRAGDEQAEYDHEAAVAADMARVRAWVESGSVKVNDERHRAGLWGLN